MKKIEIEDYLIIKPYLDNYSIEASEISFTNIYMWRKKYNFHYEIVENFLWLINVKNASTFYYSQPIGNYDDPDSLKKSISIMKNKQSNPNKKLILKKCDKRFISVLSEMNLEFVKNEIRDDFDYVYDFLELKELIGKKYHQKKNHINKFLKSYENWEYEPINPSNLKDVLDINEEWFKEAFVSNNTDLLEEYKAIRECVDKFGTLDYTGGLIKIDNKPCAFILGEKLNADTLVIHIEKADRSYNGIYPMIMHQYLLSLEESYKYINREQDLGIEGLRKAKLSYHPVKFIEKFNVEL